MTQYGVVPVESSVGDLSAPIQGWCYDQYQGWVLYADNPWMKDK